MMYLLIFLSVIKLRYSQPETKRLYKIPGGKIGLWLIAGTGAIFCVFAFILGFIPPEEYQFIAGPAYALTLLSGIIIFSAPPFLWQWWQRKNLK
jgi:amino acid transporter